MSVPYSRDMEMAALGSLLLDKDSMYIGLPALRADYFYTDSLRAIFRAIQELAMSDSPVDNATVADKARQLDSSVTYQLVEELREKTPSSVHIEYYTEILSGYAKARALLDLSAKVASVAQSTNPQHITELITKFGDDIHEVLADTSELHTAKDVMESMWKQFQLAYERGGQVEVSTGFKELDAFTGGLNRGDLVVLGGRPSMGKSSLVLSSMLHLVREQTPCAIFSYEMPKEQLGQRLAAMDAEISLIKIRTTAGLTKEELDKFTRSTGWLSSLPFYVDDGNGDIHYLAAAIRRYVRTRQVRVVYIDYLGLIPMYTDNPTVELGNFTRTLKLLAGTLDVTIVLCAQLNRAVEARAEGVPRLSDFRQSGRIEEDADIVIFVHRNKDVLPEDASIVIAKNRNGPIGSVDLYFEPTTTKFSGRG